MPSPTAPVLVRRAEPARRRTTWDAAGQRALAHTSGFLRVLGGPGTGKSTLIAELAADRIRNRDVSPEKAA
ncbi:UvrD-helicase domain-containing protein, partial [Saccharopolyspora sp. NPDC002686]|uniref:UvrD-helicase domain-containing protein n=1 Tax=Saccharopolyspora sp. NPDC002686 TaxID=3154541 RepID=UPI00332FD920